MQQTRSGSIIFRRSKPRVSDFHERGRQFAALVMVLIYREPTNDDKWDLRKNVWALRDSIPTYFETKCINIHYSQNQILLSVRTDLKMTVKGQTFHWAGLYPVKRLKRHLSNNRCRKWPLNFLIFTTWIYKMNQIWSYFLVDSHSWMFCGKVCTPCCPTFATSQHCVLSFYVSNSGKAFTLMYICNLFKLRSFLKCLCKTFESLSCVFFLVGKCFCFRPCV